MHTIKWTPWAALFIFLCSCSSVTVSHDYDVTANFSQYKTFDWVPGEQPKTGDIRVDNPFLDNRIRAAVVRIMVEKGYRKATTDKPDLLVAYNLTIRSKIESDTVSTSVGYGGYPYWGGVGFETRIREYDEGMLVIDLGDASENKLIWRGTGTRRITNQASPEKTTEIVNKTVTEILAHFPPGQK